MLLRDRQRRSHFPTDVRCSVFPLGQHVYSVKRCLVYMLVPTMSGE